MSDRLRVDYAIEEESLKVISYLWEDVPKSIRNKLFNINVRTFSQVNKLLCSDVNFNALFIDAFANELDKILDENCLLSTQPSEKPEIKTDI